MLKQSKAERGDNITLQPPSGGCVLKLVGQCLADRFDKQPPSGGCVLKLRLSR